MAGTEQLVSLVDRDGAAISVPLSSVGGFLAKGFQVEGDTQRVARVGEGQRQGDISGLEAFGQGAGRGISFGATDALQVAAGGDTARDFLKTAEEAHPGLSTAGVIAGALAPSLLAPESLLSRTPAGFSSRIGAKIADLGEARITAESARLAGASKSAASAAEALAGAGEAGAARAAGSAAKTLAESAEAAKAGGTVGSKIAATAAAGAFEGAAQDAGSYVSDVALGNRDLSVDGFLASMGKGALYGGVAGGALSVAHHRLIAARKLFPVENVTAESVARAEAEARQGVKDSIDTSKSIETTGANTVTKTDRETEQFLRDLEQERAAHLDAAAKVRTAQEQATVAPEGNLGSMPGEGDLRVAPVEYRPVAGEPVPEAPRLPTAADVTRDNEGFETTVNARDLHDHGFSRLDNMQESKLIQARKHIAEGQQDPITVLVDKKGGYYVDDGRHRLQAAIEANKPVKVKWWRGGEAGGEGEEFVGGARAPKQPAELMKAWREKYPEGAVTLDSANAAARKERLRSWAEGFEAKTPEDETIKAYFSEPQDPVRTRSRLGDPDAPKAVQQAANKAAADAAHTAYNETIASAANVSKSGTELAARATYAGRRAAARALDDVYTAYAAGKPIVDIRSAVTKRLTGQLHELAEARADMLSALAKSESAGEVVSKAAASGEKSLGQRILEGAKAPVDADAAVQSALGASKNVNADIADVAPKITRYEAAKATLTESLGDEASQAAKEHAQAFREAEAKANAANAKRTAQAAENVEAATTRDVPTDKLPGGNPKLGGFKKQLGTAGEIYEALHSFGLPLPGLHSIPVIGPILSTFLKAKVLGKVLHGHGGSFAATAEGTIAAKAAAVQNRVNTAVQGMFTKAAKVADAAAGPVSAGAALGFKLFDDGQQTKPYSSTPDGGKPEELYAQRLEELSAAMQPGAIDREVRARVNTSDPSLIDQIVAAEQRRLQYLYDQAPKPNTRWPGEPPQSPSRQEIGDFGNVLAAYHDPAAVFEKVAAGGTARPSEVACVANCYPSLYQQAVTKVAEMLSDGKQPTSYQQRLSMSALTGIPMDRSMSPDYSEFLHAQTAAAVGGGAPPAMPTKRGHKTGGGVHLGTRTLTRLDR